VKIAIIGSGIAGNVAAHRLAAHHDITVFEANRWPGGHTNTVDVEAGGKLLAVDTGFIVFNDRTYPNFIRLLDELGQESRNSEMSFSVKALRSGLEYCGSSLNGLFADRRNLLRPSFHRMIRDILRFNRNALPSLDVEEPDQTVGGYLQTHGYSPMFRDHYLVPMAAAIWSAEPAAIDDMPLRFLVRFFDNHGLLQLDDRPQWKTIVGGSREYVRKLIRPFADRIRLSSPVESVRRFTDHVEIYTASGGREIYDAIFMACHSDQALRMLADPSPAESAVLSAIEYQDNEAILHTDERVLPQRRRAWAAWNYHLPEAEQAHVAVTYNMNILQGLDAESQYLVTLNDDSNIDPGRIIRRIQNQHPIFSQESVAAQARQEEINCDRTYFCGAYWRHGFHEDGVVSALNALRHFEEREASGQLHIRRAG
jgi:predicted NAD/FAD-binding protein